MHSLPDWAFYPAAALVTAAMLAGALGTGDRSVRSAEEILTEGVMFEGDALNALTLGNGLSAQFLVDGEETFARIDAVRGPLEGMQSAGAFFTLSPAELEALQGHRIRLQFSLRSADENGAANTRLNFFVPGRGQGDWQEQAVGGSFETVTLEIAVPACTWEFGYIGLWPDWTANQNTIDLERIELTALDANEGC